MNVYQVAWRPGTDQLLGRCHCGAEHLAEDPIEMWTWLLAHPDGHDRLDTGESHRTGSLVAGSTR